MVPPGGRLYFARFSLTIPAWGGSTDCLAMSRLGDAAGREGARKWTNCWERGFPITASLIS